MICLKWNLYILAWYLKVFFLIITCFFLQQTNILLFFTFMSFFILFQVLSLQLCQATEDQKNFSLDCTVHIWYSQDKTRKALKINISLCLHSIKEISGNRVMTEPNRTFSNLDSLFYFFIDAPQICIFVEEFCGYLIFI